MFDIRLTGDEFPGCVVKDNWQDNNRNHGAPQGRSAGHDTPQETPAAAPATQRSDRAHGTVVCCY